ncbi:hypothetical protein CsSME_00042469 [Camellia sinensis var. sinensis]
MESLSMRHLISATHNSILTRYPSSSSSSSSSSTPIRVNRFRNQDTHFRFVLCSQKSAFQGAQAPEILEAALDVHLTRARVLEMLGIVLDRCPT